MDRYKKVLDESNVPIDKDFIKKEIEKISEKLPELKNTEVFTKIFNCIDLTTLNTTDSQDSVRGFIQRVNDFDNEYPQYPNVAAVCVFSNFAGLVRASLEVTGV